MMSHSLLTLNKVETKKKKNEIKIKNKIERKIKFSPVFTTLTIFLVGSIMI